MQTGATNNQPSAVRIVASAAWWLQLVAPLLLAIWLFLDSYMAHVRLFSQPVSFYELTENTTASRLILVRLLTLVFVAAWLASLVMFLTSFPQAHSLRKLFVLTTSVAIWLALTFNWGNIVELGQSLRFRTQQRHIQQFAKLIDDRWQEICNDPRQQVVPNFNGYPLYEPTLLLFLGDHKIPGTNIGFCAIERSENHSVRFQLGGANFGWWLEVRRDRENPKKFVGGLEEVHYVDRFRSFSEGSYMVRYSAH